MNATLQGSANGNYVSWWVSFATTEMVIAWSPKSRFAAQFQDAKDGKRSFESVLTEPGLRFGRTDPQIDPKGYRTVFTFDLDAKRLGDPTLPRKVLGDPGNPSQLFLEEQLVARLQAGELDAGAFSRLRRSRPSCPI